MYPLFRLFYHRYRASRKPQLENPFQVCVQSMRVWPWDIDVFMELNNGRYLTIMDIGRFSIGTRTGLFEVLKANNWGLMVGGVSSRYRRRLRPFERFTLHTKLLHFDERWFYFHQWFKGSKGVHASFLVRTAVTSSSGLVPTSDVIQAMPYDPELLLRSNPSSEWLKKWEASDLAHKEVMEKLSAIT